VQQFSSAVIADASTSPPLPCTWVVRTPLM